MMALKKFLNDDTLKWFQKSSTIIMSKQFKKGSTMMVLKSLKRFLNDASKKISLTMELKRFNIGGTKHFLNDGNKRFISDGT